MFVRIKSFFMKKLAYLSIFVLGISACSSGQFNLGKAFNNAEKKVTADVDSLKGGKGGSSTGLTKEDIANGLKEALKVGSNNAGSNASKVDGFFKDSIIK